MKFALTVNTDDPREITSVLVALTGAGAMLALLPPGNGAEDDDGEDTGTASTIVSTPGAVDARGLPWDERIHASTKAITANGFWRAKRGVDQNIVSFVENELRTRGFGTPGAAGTALPPVPVPAPAPPQPAIPSVPSTPAIPAAPSAPAIPSMPSIPAAPLAPVIDFAFIAFAMQRAVQAGILTPEGIGKIGTEVGVTDLNALQTTPDPAKFLAIYQVMVRDNLFIPA